MRKGTQSTNITADVKRVVAARDECDGGVGMKDLTGQRFGNLIVIQKSAPHVSPSGKRHSMWECKCDCGKICFCYTDHLVSGRKKSCGCMRNPSGENHPNHKHGQYNTRLYRVWQGMKHRCYCETSTDWNSYGGKGIKVCDEWRNDFSSFRVWALENGYDENAPFMQCTIDRIDVDGDYCPENCRWVTAREQCNNYSRNIRITYKGETHTLKEWSQILNFPYDRINQRMRRGMSFEEAIQK